MKSTDVLRNVPCFAFGRGIYLNHADADPAASSPSDEGVELRSSSQVSPASTWLPVLRPILGTRGRRLHLRSVGRLPRFPLSGVSKE
jgi:hypothetical protein